MARRVDPVTAYAKRVKAGKEVVSYLVRLACLRHLNDLERQSEKGLRWRPEKAQDVIDFFAEVLCLPENTEADEEASDEGPSADPRPFVLQPWQQFIVGSLFGWYTEAGFRRFREAYIEASKGSGKTPCCAGMMLWMLIADGQRGAQCFFAATTKEQAGIAFSDAVKMVNASPYLLDVVEVLANNISVPEDGSFLRPVSSEKRGLDGKRVHGACCDELHEAPSPVVINKMRAGTKGMRNALILKPTNSGYDRSSVCWAHHEHSRKVLEGTIENEAWFAFVCGLDPCQEHQDKGLWFPADDCAKCDSWEREGPHWKKANPNLGVSVPWQYVRERVKQAQGMPTEVSDVQRFNFCIWTQGMSRAFNMARWAACRPIPSDEELIGAICVGCLDIGETDDFTAFGKLWLLDDGRVVGKFRYWLPASALQRFPGRPYDAWRRVGNLWVTDGDVTDYSRVRKDIIDDVAKFGIESIYYDPKTARETAQILTGAGIEMVQIPQGFALHEAIEKVGELVLTGNFCHDNEQILTWMASNAVIIKGSDGRKRLDKMASPEKVDGIAALLMGIEGGVVRRERTETVDYSQSLHFLGGR